MFLFVFFERGDRHYNFHRNYFFPIPSKFFSAMLRLARMTLTLHPARSLPLSLFQKRLPPRRSDSTKLPTDSLASKSCYHSIPPSAAPRHQKPSPYFWNDSETW